MSVFPNVLVILLIWLLLEPWNHELSELDGPFKSSSSATFVSLFTLEIFFACVVSFLAFKENILKRKFIVHCFAFYKTYVSFFILISGSSAGL